jgi:hypothetical protein
MGRTIIGRWRRSPPLTVKLYPGIERRALLVGAALNRNTSPISTKKIQSLRVADEVSPQPSVRSDRLTINKQWLIYKS